MVSRVVREARGGSDNFSDKQRATRKSHRQLLVLCVMALSEACERLSPSRASCTSATLASSFTFLRVHVRNARLYLPTYLPSRAFGVTGHKCRGIVNTSFLKAVFVFLQFFGVRIYSKKWKRSRNSKSECVSVKLERMSKTFQPIRVNFFLRYGGAT